MTDLFRKGFKAGLGAGLLLSEGLATKAQEMLEAVQGASGTMHSATDSLEAGIARELENLRVQGEE